MSLPTDHLIYQLWLGRSENASIITHQNNVLKLLNDTFNWKVLKESGFTHVYLLGLFDYRGPIIATSEENLDLTSAARLPSPFAISNHTTIHPDLGSLDDFSNLVNTLHSHQLKVILDFVPNHTGTTHSWVSDHPTYYVHKSGKMVPEFSNDVFKLDYTNKALQEEMINVIQTIAGFGIDGLRVDMAHLIPQNFWQQAITQTKQAFPQLLWIAESYETSPFDHQQENKLLDAGFDVIYDQYTYENTLRSNRDKNSISNLIEHLNYLIQQKDTKTPLQYLMNHDEHSALEYGLLPAYMSILALNPNPLLVFNGQLHGRTKRLAHHIYDELPASQNELEQGIPDWFHNLQMVKKALNLTIVKINTLDDSLIQCELIIDNHPAILMTNYSHQATPLPHPHTIKFPGLLHNLTHKDPLQSGQAEVFFLNN